MKNEIILSFGIWGFDDINHDEISKTLGIIPSKIYIKGEKKNPKNLTSTALIQKNGWIMNSLFDQYSAFDKQMDSLLNIIEEKISLFRPFCEKYTCEFSCALFIRFNNGESTPWVHLNSRYNHLIKQLNIEFDIDIYCIPDEEEMV